MTAGDRVRYSSWRTQFRAEIVLFLNAAMR
jgi:hypothetical protein